VPTRASLGHKCLECLTSEVYAGARCPVNIGRASVTRRRKGDKAIVAEVLPLLAFVMAFAKEQSPMTLGTY
jgi:hypothetical protein